MYSLIRPWVTAIWGWKQVLINNEPNWVFWDLLDSSNILFVLLADDAEFCKLLIQSIFNEN